MHQVIFLIHYSFLLSTNIYSFVHHITKMADFLDASTHLYKRVRTSVGRSVGRSVCWSVGLLVGNRLFFTGRYSKEKMRRPPCFLWSHTFTETWTRVCWCVACLRRRCSEYRLSAAVAWRLFY